MPKTAPRKYQVISADGHVETPPETWVKYVPEQYKHRAPRLIKLPEGGEGWIVEGQPLLHNGQNITGGKKVKFRNDSYFNPDGSPAPGAGDAKQRLKEQDIDGLDAEILFPPVFATRFIEGIADKKGYVSMVQAYNTFLAQDYCAVAPDRLIGNAVIPQSGIEDAIAELRRVKELGLPSIALHQFPNGGGASKPKEDDRFWEEVQKLDIKLSPHFGFGDRQINMAGNAGAGTGNASFVSQISGGGALPACIAWMIADGTFDRFPEMKFYFAETNAGWMPWALWKNDDQYQIMRWFFNVTLKMKPSEYVAKHCLFSFIRDPISMKLREFLPWQNLMWGSDFPHSVGSYPESRKWIEMIFDGVPENVKRKILLENPAKFFDLDLEKPITPTPA